MTAEEDPIFSDELKEEAFRRILVKEAFEKGEYELAFKELMILAEKGFPDMQYTLALMHLNGHGVKVDTDMAIMWFYISAKSGFENAVKAIDGLEKNLPSEKLAKAQELAREWVKENYTAINFSKEWVKKNHKMPE